MHKILIVDDDRASCDLLRAGLSEGYEGIDTQGPEQALGLALEHNPDAIVLDLMMPKFSGFELCQSFRSLSYTSTIPIPVVTGGTEAKYKDRCANLAVEPSAQRRCSGRTLTRFCNAHRDAGDAPDNGNVTRITDPPRMPMGMRSRNQNQLAAIQFTPTADVAIAKFEEKNRAIELIMPIYGRDGSLPGIDLDEGFWTLDAESKNAVYVNQAYETITGRSLQSLAETPSSYQDVIHPDDRVYVLERLEEAAQSGHFDEKFRIVTPDARLRWVWVRGFPVKEADGRITRLVGTALEITAQKEAEDRVAQNLALAQSAWAEADALRKATLGLVQDLRMDFVLGALLQSLADLIPFTCARVLIPEGGPHVLALGEKRCPEDPKSHSEQPLTLNADESPFLKHILADQKSFLIPDTEREDSWSTFEAHAHLRSWLSVPLVAAGQYLGFLSVGHTEPNRFTADHLRRAELLAIPAAAAIQNSRLYERAAIYGEELERRVKDLRQTQTALLQAEERRRISEEKFQKVFRASPIPFSITTLAEGRFVDVNAAFERRYGYSRKEVLGHTVHELRIWEDPQDRALMIAQLQRGPVRNVITRLRTRMGEIRTSFYSADRVQFEGQTCILAVSEDVPENTGLSH